MWLLENKFKKQETTIQKVRKNVFENCEEIIIHEYSIKNRKNRKNVGKK